MRYDLSQHGVWIEPDKRVMIVLATLEAARTTNEAGETAPLINTPLSAEGIKFRELLKSDLAALNNDLRQRISTFVINHKRRNPELTDAELVAPFISMAYALTPAPELSDPVVTSDLPGKLLDVLDFAPLVRDFYRRSSFAGNINEYVKTYQRTADSSLKVSAQEMVGDILSYLNTKPRLTFIERTKVETQRTRSKKSSLQTIEVRERERSFRIVPELLAPKGNVIFVNVKDEYFAVVPADHDLSVSDVRRGFLQFVVDPIVLGVNKEIESVRPAIKKILDERRAVDSNTSPDIYLTISRSLVAAVDAKQLEYEKVKTLTNQARQNIDRAASDAEKRSISEALLKRKGELEDETALRLSEDYEKGALLAFYFAEQLDGFEDSGFDIASSMREMVLSFDAAKEVDRLGNASAARKRALALREDKNKAANTGVIVENPLTSKLIDVQKLIGSRDFTAAAAELKLLREKNPSEPRVYYNIGRVASLVAEDIEDEDAQKEKLLEAKVAYENVIRTATANTDKALLSLTYVALARIYEFYGDRTYAISVYDKAIDIGRVNGGAYDEAISGKAVLIKEQ